MKLDYWTNYFRGFNPKEQLQVAEVIKNELQANERNKDDDDYDVSKSEQVRKYFESLLETVSKKEDIEKRKDLLKKYDELSLKYRLKVLDETIETIEYIFKKQELEKGAAICQKEGHIFGDWEEHTWTTIGDTMIDHQLIEGVTLHHSEWRRECPRCSCIEKSRFEPEEARIKRIEREKIESAQRAEQAKKERIKELRKELRKLERNNK